MTDRELLAAAAQAIADRVCRENGAQLRPYHVLIGAEDFEATARTVLAVVAPELRRRVFTEVTEAYNRWVTRGDSFASWLEHVAATPEPAQGGAPTATSSPTTCDGSGWLKRAAVDAVGCPGCPKCNPSPTREP